MVSQASRRLLKDASLDRGTEGFTGRIHGQADNSIVLRMEVGGTRVLLTGDAEAQAEASMAGEDVQAEVLKVGRHGSAYSTSDAWLDRVQPRIAVFSCGRHNHFGHPNPGTLDRLRRHGVQVYRTDQDGAVTLELGREGWIVRTMNHPVPAPSWSSSRRQRRIHF